MKRQSLKKADHRWIVGTAIFGVVFAAYITLSIALWNAYSSTADDRRSDMRDDIAQLASADSSIAQREQIADSLKSRIESVCEPPAIIAWQQYAVGRASEAVRACEDKGAVARNTVQSYTDMTAYLRDEQYFDQIIRNAMAEDRTTEDASYDAHVAVWTKAAQQIADRQVVEGARDLQKELQEVTTQIAEAWNSVEGERYDELLVTYDKLSNIAPLATEVRSDIQADVARQVRSAVE